MGVAADEGDAAKDALITDKWEMLSNRERMAMFYLDREDEDGSRGVGDSWLGVEL